MSSTENHRSPHDEPAWIRRIRTGLWMARLTFRILLITSIVATLLLFIPAYRVEQERHPALAIAADHLADRRLDDAREAFDALLHRYPDEIRARFGLMEVEAASEDYSEALEKAHHISAEAAALREAPTRERAARRLVGIVSPSARAISPAEPYARLIQWLPWEGAESILEEAGRRALDLDPDSPWGAVAMGRTLLDHNKPEHAVTVLRHGLAHSTGPRSDLALHWLLTEAYLRTGNWADAVDSVNRAIALDPENPNLKAMQFIAEGFLARKLDPDHPPAAPATAPPDPPEEDEETNNTQFPARNIQSPSENEAVLRPSHSPPVD